MHKDVIHNDPLNADQRHRSIYIDIDFASHSVEDADE